MKGLSFTEFLSFLKLKDNGYYSIPVIAVTGVPLSISEKDKTKLAAILEKPFTPETLLDIVSQVLKPVPLYT